jgi:hypothetical protein
MDGRGGGEVVELEGGVGDVAVAEGGEDGGFFGGVPDFECDAEAVQGALEGGRAADFFEGVGGAGADGGGGGEVRGQGGGEEGGGEFFHGESFCCGRRRNVLSRLRGKSSKGGEKAQVDKESFSG